MSVEIYHLTDADIQDIAEQLFGSYPVRDPGLIASALGRPAASMFGVEAYPTLHEKAAALLQSLACNHALVDGDKRLALTASVMFLARNGIAVDGLDQDLAYGLVMAVATKELENVPEIAARLFIAVGA